MARPSLVMGLINNLILTQLSETEDSQWEDKLFEERELYESVFKVDDLLLHYYAKDYIENLAAILNYMLKNSVLSVFDLENDSLLSENLKNHFLNMLKNNIDNQNILENFRAWKASFSFLPIHDFKVPFARIFFMEFEQDSQPTYDKITEHYKNQRTNLQFRLNKRNNDSESTENDTQSSQFTGYLESQTKLTDYQKLQYSARLGGEDALIQTLEKKLRGSWISLRLEDFKQDQEDSYLFNRDFDMYGKYLLQDMFTFFLLDEEVISGKGQNPGNSQAGQANSETIFPAEWYVI